MAHIDLYTGLAGFALACHWAGIETEVMCENDERCRQFLERTWGKPIVPDVREFDGTRWRGRFLLTAGVPCQPASRAGKQRGKEDDRWLWDETLRVVSEARPDWCLFENPVGIDDVGLGGILADLEAQGYEVAPPLIIPACAVNAPQLRARYWIVAHTAARQFPAGAKKMGDNSKTKSPHYYSHRPNQGNISQTWPVCKTNHDLYGDRSHNGRKLDRAKLVQEPTESLPEGKNENGRGLSSLQRSMSTDRPCGTSGSDANSEDTDKCHSLFGGALLRLRTMQRSSQEKGGNANTFSESARSSQGNMADTELQRRRQVSKETPRGWRTSEFEWGHFWQNSLWLPCADGKVRRAPDDTFGVVDGLHRSLLAALGNSIVPQVGYEIIRAIKEADATTP